MSPDPELNPYAPPSSELIGNHGYPGRRPAAVKWAMTVLILMFGVACVTIIMNARARGWHSAFFWFRIDPWFASLDALARLLGMVVVFGGRRTSAFWCGVAALGWTCFQLPRNVWFRMINRGGELQFPVSAMVAVVVMGLIYWLFFRYAFGKPTRRYYRLIERSADSNE